MVSIHRRRPRGYWVRIWRRRGGLSRTRKIHKCKTLKESRAFVPEGMVVAERSDGDAPDLVEIWCAEKPDPT